MSTTTLHDLNQRYTRLTDRCRSQWTFYQLQQGLFKHLRQLACPVEIDYQALFAELRSIGETLAHPETERTMHSLDQLAAKLDVNTRKLVELDAGFAPSMLRRFFDRLRNQDEKVLLAIIKFYVDSEIVNDDTLDKLDILFTRLAEIPREDGSSLTRERHEIERLVTSLLHHRPTPTLPDHEVEILVAAITELRQQATTTTSFSALVEGGALDRFRALKRRLGPALLHPVLLPRLLETTVALKNRFRELWEEEERQLLDDTNRVREMQRQLSANPEMLSTELRELLETFSTASRRFDQERQDENLRREHVVELRRTLNRILEQFDAETVAPAAGEPGQPPAVVEPGDEIFVEQAFPTVAVPDDPLLHDYLNKIVFALELAGRDRAPEDVAQAKEVAGLALEPWEVAACLALVDGRLDSASLPGQVDHVLITAAALRLRLDEEASEIERLQRRGSDRVGELLASAAQTLQRAAEVERRFQWLIDDALYRGDTERLEPLHRSRFRLLRSYSALWLTHNERGGISPF